MPVYEIQVCRPEMAKKVARAKMSAFYGNRDWRSIWHIPLEDIITACGQREAHNLTKERSVKRHEMVVDTETGDVAGYARWKIPDDMPNMWPEAQVRQISPQEEEEFKTSFDNSDWHPRGGEPDSLVAAREKAKTKYLYGKKQLVLEYLAVHPDHQRRGVATMLVRSGIAQADAFSIDSYMMAFPDGKEVYSKLGFEILETVTGDNSPWGGDPEYTEHYMLRKARTPGSS